MKLRLRDNSLRIRLTRSEVENLSELRPVMSVTKLGPLSENGLSYCVLPSRLTDSVQVTFENNTIRVVIPESRARAWLMSPDVGIYAEQIISPQETLMILIEKDFFCLKPRSHEQENEADMFPNPNASTGRCG